jgi:pyruvate,water dikinase
MIYVANIENAIPDPNLFGTKASNLIQMIKSGVNIPIGLIVNTDAYYKFLEDSNIKQKIHQLLINEYNAKDVIVLSKKITKHLLKPNIPDEIKSEINISFNAICENLGQNTSFSVRSSATIEDTNLYSFAGQADSYLNLKTSEEIMQGIKNCWVSLFSPNALLYMLQIRKKGVSISLGDLGIAVIIQKMIKSQISGVLFTSNVINNSENEMFINSTWGLGDTITNNLVIPDMIILSKKTFSIVKYIIGDKEKTSIPKPNGSSTILIPTEQVLRLKHSLNESQLYKLYNLGLQLEQYFKSPQDIEWAIENDVLYILQSRPITTLKPRSNKYL